MTSVCVQMMADHTRSTGGIDFDPDDDFNPFSEDEVGSHAVHTPHWQHIMQQGLVLTTDISALAYICIPPFQDEEIDDDGEDDDGEDDGGKMAAGVRAIMLECAWDARGGDDRVRSRTVDSGMYMCESPNANYAADAQDASDSVFATAEEFAIMLQNPGQF